MDGGTVTLMVLSHFLDHQTHMGGMFNHGGVKHFVITVLHKERIKVSISLASLLHKFVEIVF